jgi:hypothetical protein
MKSTLLIVALMAAAVSPGIAQKPDGLASPAPRLYELYSWPQPNGIWNFCLLPSPSGVNIPVEAIFDKKLHLTGLGQLKEKISQLPTDTTILWMNGITSGQTPTAQSRKLALPPAETVEQVKRYAEKRGIHVQVLDPSPD